MQAEQRREKELIPTFQLGVVQGTLSRREIYDHF